MFLVSNSRKGILYNNNQNEEAKKQQAENKDKQKKFERKIFFVFFVFYIPLLLPFTHDIYNLSTQQSFWISSIIVLAAIGTIFAVYYHRENYRKFVGDDLPKKRDTTTGSLLVLAGIYAIVASFAITASLEGFFKALTSTNATIRDPSQLFSLLGSNYDYFSD